MHHLVYTMQMRSFTQMTTTILNKLTPTYNKSSTAYTMTSCTKNKSFQSEGSASSAQQTLACISLPQHLPSCLLLQDSAGACRNYWESSWLLQCSSSRQLVGFWAVTDASNSPLGAADTHWEVPAAATLPSEGWAEKACHSRLLLATKCLPAM